MMTPDAGSNYIRIKLDLDPDGAPLPTWRRITGYHSPKLAPNPAQETGALRQEGATPPKGVHSQSLIKNQNMIGASSFFPSARIWKLGKKQ